jgi:pre-mRNA-processing factor 19
MQSTETSPPVPPKPISLEFYTLDVFTTERYLGNPLAVVLVRAEDNDSLTQDRKQRVAREFNLSETVFMHLPPGNGKTCKIDIFLVNREIAWAGHPTIGSAYLLLHEKARAIDTLETLAGSVYISKRGEGVYAKISHQVHLHGQTLGSVLHEGHSQYPALSNVASIRHAQLAAPVMSIVRGMTFILVQLKSEKELGQLGKGRAIDYDEVHGLLDEGEWADSFISRYHYVDLGLDSASDTNVRKLRTRLVDEGPEDPATGSAACALVSHLALSETPASELTEGSLVKLRYLVTQGVEMGRESNITIEVVLGREPKIAKDGQLPVRIEQIYLEGSAIIVMEGTIKV